MSHKKKRRKRGEDLLCQYGIDCVIFLASGQLIYRIFAILYFIHLTIYIRVLCHTKNKPKNVQEILELARCLYMGTTQCGVFLSLLPSRVNIPRVTVRYSIKIVWKAK